MKIGVIGDNTFDDETILEYILSKELITEFAYDATGRFRDILSRFSRRCSYPVCALKDVDKVLVFHGNGDSRLIARLQTAKSKGYKIKIIKYNLL
jgi:hypothetical protein